MRWNETYWGKKLESGDITEEDRIVAKDWEHCPVGELVDVFRLKRESPEHSDGRPRNPYLYRMGMRIYRHLCAGRFFLARWRYKQAFKRAEALGKEEEEALLRAKLIRGIPPWREGVK